jgi:hypothetical protein
MMQTQRVTVTLPPEVVEAIDRQEPNRSRFILQAVQHELQRRRREALRRSLEAPHPESVQTADLGFEEWVSEPPAGEAEGLVDPQAGREVRWVPGRGWLEVTE